jgi:glycosyltransferase
VNVPAEVGRCAAVVHQGGAGIAYATLDAGIPAVCLPQLGDQFRNAALLARVGACLVAEPEAATEPQMRDAISTVLDDAAYAEATQRMREANRALPDVDTLILRLVTVD